MRVLVAHSARGAIGGIESYLRCVAPRLAARGHAVALVFEQRFETPGADGDDPYAVCAAEWCVAELGVAETAAAVRAWRPERVWVHGLENGTLEAQLLEVAPALRFVHNYDGCCATGEKFRRWPRPAPCARRMGPACMAINFTRNCGRLRPAGFAASFERQRRRAADFQRYRQLQAASRHMQAELQRQARGAVALLPYPLLEARAPAPMPRTGPPRHVLMLARLTVGKGGEQLLRALAVAERRLGRRLRVTIAGEGPERPKLERLAHTLDLEAHFPGWVDAATRRRLLAETDVLAMPSLWPEPFGLAGLEAAAQAVPAVAYAVGGIPEWLQAGESGELAPGTPPTIDGLTQALIRALVDTGRWSQQRQRAWERSAAFGLDAHLDAVEASLVG